MLQVDYDLLFAHPLQAESLNKAFAYYQTWWDSPVAVKALLHAAALAPVLALAIKLNAWTESAIFFDGSSLGALCPLLFLSLPILPFLRLPSIRGCVSGFLSRSGGREGGGGGRKIENVCSPIGLLNLSLVSFLHLTAQSTPKLTLS